MLQYIDNQRDVGDDRAHDLAQSLWLEVCTDHTQKYSNESYVSFVGYLELVKQGAQARCFVYELAIVHGGKIKGVMWQTTTMSNKYERFRKSQCFDMMGRAINTLLWLYVVVDIYNELDQLCLVCEDIIC